MDFMDRTMPWVVNSPIMTLDSNLHFKPVGEYPVSSAKEFKNMIFFTFYRAARGLLPHIYGDELMTAPL